MRKNSEERNVNINYNARFLPGIQGNILQPHKRNHAIHLFISFGDIKGRSGSIRSWISSFAGKISSAQQEIDLKRAGLFYSFLLSKSGYQSLEYKMPEDVAFCEGMKQRGALLNDSESREWEAGYNKDIDGLIILAGDDSVLLASQSVLVKESLARSGVTVLIEEVGNKLTRNDLEIEHFGFVDGISQPGEKSLKADDSAPEQVITDPGVVLVNDPFSESLYGSFLVFRKLEQNVLLWEENIKALAENTQTDPFLAGAFTIGRFKDGTSIMEFNEMQSPIVPDNHFKYESDKEGSRCPLHAHMRKMNIRENGNAVRIARRGMTYGLRADLHPQGRMFKPPDKGVGLLFMCYQDNISEGFEYLQRIANDPSLPYSNSGLDPVISQGASKKIPNTWPVGYGSSQRVAFSFDRTVTLKGGEYFFAPAIDFLKYGIK